LYVPDQNRLYEIRKEETKGKCKLTKTGIITEVGTNYGGILRGCQMSRDKALCVHLYA